MISNIMFVHVKQWKLLVECAGFVVGRVAAVVAVGTSGVTVVAVIVVAALVTLGVVLLLCTIKWLVVIDTTESN